MTRNLSCYDNHRLTAKHHLLEQDKNKPLLNGLLDAIIDPLQEIENKLFNIYENGNLNKAAILHEGKVRKV